jgi:hypothetical protein
MAQRTTKLWSLRQIPLLPVLYQRPVAQRLASGAEVGATVLHHAPLDGAAANGAGFASSMSNPKIEMGYADFVFVFFSPDPLAGVEFPVMWPSSPGSVTS